MPKVAPTLSPEPLGELAAAIREYLCAADRGEDEHFCGDLVTRIHELGLTCRPKHDEYELLCSGGGGRTAHMLWTYSKIIVELKGPDGRLLGGWIKGRLYPVMPSELDRELDRISIELARAEYEREYGQRAKDEKGRPLRSPATERLLALADRFEAHQAGDGSAAEGFSAPASAETSWRRPKEPTRPEFPGKIAKNWFKLKDARELYRMADAGGIALKRIGEPRGRKFIADQDDVGSRNPQALDDCRGDAGSER